MSKEVEKVVEQHRARMQLLEGEQISFDRALKDILLGEKDRDKALFEL